MSALMTRPALAVLAALFLLWAGWAAYRFAHHKHGPNPHRGPRWDRGPVTDPRPWPAGAADMTMPGAFLQAPTEIIPIKRVHGAPPWPLAQRHEELIPLPEPGPPPIVADITRDGAGASLTDPFTTALHAAVRKLDGHGADRVYELMGGDR